MPIQGARHRARISLVLLAILGSILALAVAAPPASAATPVGRVEHADQSVTGRLTVSGWAFDPAHRTTRITISIWVDGHFVHSVVTDRGRADVNRARHLTGAHGFAATFALHRPARVVELRTRSGRVRVASLAVRQNAGARIIASARQYVGRSPYVDGGASPSGFDCSGYTMYVYRQAGVARLPHSAEGQRRLMRQVSRAQARPGDLIFYMSGGTAFHVAIYTGNGMQYAAATAQDGLRYQGIWSSDVQFRTDWH